eukprot:Rmarinus@m.25169
MWNKRGVVILLLLCGSFFHAFSVDVRCVLSGSVLNSSSPGSNPYITPQNFDVTLGVGSDLEIEVTVTQQAVQPALDVYLIQDLSGSYGDDIQNIRSDNLISQLWDELADDYDLRMGVGAYVDKPMSPFGSSYAEYAFYNYLSMTTSKSTAISTYDNLVVRYGNDGPEAQAEALLQAAMRSDASSGDLGDSYMGGPLGMSSDRRRVAILFTDNRAHLSGDGSPYGLVTNDYDAEMEGSSYTVPHGSCSPSPGCWGTTEDYPSVAKLGEVLAQKGIFPVFCVTSNYVSTYQGFVDQWGFGSVVTLSRNSDDLVAAVTEGVTDSQNQVILSVEQDPQRYVRNIRTSGSSATVEDGKITASAQTSCTSSSCTPVDFIVTLHADGDEMPSTVTLQAFGLGTVTIDVSLADISDAANCDREHAVAFDGSGFAYPSGGGIYSNLAHHVLDGFRTEFTFNMAGSEGFAFVLHTDSRGSTYAPSGSSSGAYLGYDGMTNSIAIEFDTAQQSSAGDLDNNHISVHTRDSDANSYLESYSIGYTGIGQLSSVVNLASGTHVCSITYTSCPPLMTIAVDGTDVLVVSLDLVQMDMFSSTSKAWIGFLGSHAASSVDESTWSFETTVMDHKASILMTSTASRDPGDKVGDSISLTAGLSSAFWLKSRDSCNLGSVSDRFVSSDVESVHLRTPSMDLPCSFVFDGTNFKITCLPEEAHLSANLIVNGECIRDQDNDCTDLLVLPGSVYGATSDFSTDWTVEVGEPAGVFAITDKDYYGNVIDYETYGMSPTFSWTPQSSSGQLTNFQHSYLGSGSWSVSYDCTNAGNWGLSVPSLVSGTVEVRPGSIDALSCEIVSCPDSVTAGNTGTCLIAAYDRYGNQQWESSSSIAEQFVVNYEWAAEDALCSDTVSPYASTPGYYSSQFTCNVAGGPYVVSFTHLGVASPSTDTVSVTAAGVSVSNSFATGSLVESSAFIAGDTGDAFVTLRDQFDNLITTGSHTVTLSVLGPENQEVQLSWNSATSQYETSGVSLEKVGSYSMSITLKLEEVEYGAVDTNTFTVSAAGPNAANSYITLDDGWVMTAGEPLSFAFALYDAYGNAATVSADLACTMTHDGSATLPVDYTDTSRPTCSATSQIAAASQVVCTLLESELDSKSGEVVHNDLVWANTVMNVGATTVVAGTYPSQSNSEKIHLTLFDMYNNPYMGEVSPAIVPILSTDSGTSPTVTITRASGNMFVFAFNPVIVGSYSLDASHNGIELENAQSISVTPAAISASHCVASGNGLSGGKAEEATYFTVFARDQYGNQRDASGEFDAEDIIFQGNSEASSIQVSVDDTVELGRYDYTVTPFPDCDFVDPDDCNEFRDLDVRVGGPSGTHISGSPFTVFYGNAGNTPEETLAYGEGLEGCEAGETCTFTIVAQEIIQDAVTPRTEGGDPFGITIEGAVTVVCGIQGGIQSGTAYNADCDPSDETCNNYCSITDNNDGTYDVSYEVRVSGDYSVHVTSLGQPIYLQKQWPFDPEDYFDKSQYAVSPKAAPIVPTVSAMSRTTWSLRDGRTGGEAGELQSFDVFVRDRFGNLQDDTDDFGLLAFAVTGPVDDDFSDTITAVSPGTYAGSLSLETTGDYIGALSHASLTGDVSGNVQIVPAPTAAQQSEASGLPVTYAAGQSAEVVVTPHDEFGNSRLELTSNSESTQFTYSVSLEGSVQKIGSFSFTSAGESYTTMISLTKTGEFDVSLAYKGETFFTSQITVTCASLDVDDIVTFGLTDDLIMNGGRPADDTFTFRMQSLDPYGNLCVDGEDAYSARLVSSNTGSEVSNEGCTYSDGDATLAEPHYLCSINIQTRDRYRLFLADASANERQFDGLIVLAAAADAANSLADLGESEPVVGTTQYVYVTLRDRFGNVRDASAADQARLSLSGPVSDPANILDAEFVYSIEYAAFTVAGVHSIEVLLDGDKHVAASPYSVEFVAGSPVGSTSTLNLAAGWSIIAGDTIHATVTVRDAYGNAVTDTSGVSSVLELFSVNDDSTVETVDMTLLEEGVFEGNVGATAMGAYEVHAQVNEQTVAGSPAAGVIEAGLIDLGATSLSLSSNSVVAGEIITIEDMSFYDSYGNQHTNVDLSLESIPVAASTIARVSSTSAYSFEVQLTRTPSYDVAVRVNQATTTDPSSALVPGSPATINVSPGPVSVASEIVADEDFLFAGVPSSVTVNAKDQYGNAVEPDSGTFAITSVSVDTGLSFPFVAELEAGSSHVFTFTPSIDGDYVIAAAINSEFQEGSFAEGPLSNSPLLTGVSPLVCTDPLYPYKYPNGTCLDSWAYMPELFDRPVCSGSTPVACWSGECVASVQDCDCVDMNKDRCPDGSCRDAGQCLRAPVCPSSAPVLCDDGISCRTDPLHCPTQVVCPPGFALCDDGLTCKHNSADCPAVVSCSGDMPVACRQGVCVDSVSSCPSSVTCPEDYIQCPDGSCKTSAHLCLPPGPPPFTCYDPIPFMCPDGSCRSDASACPSYVTCPSPYSLCPDGQCVLDPATECDVELEPLSVCPFGTMRCPDGSCTRHPYMCPSKKVCPADLPVRCPDGSCQSSAYECDLKLDSCADVSLAPYTCPDGTCSHDFEVCPSSVTCPLERAVKCDDGSCVSDISECPAPVTSCPSRAPHRCGDGSCRLSIEDCPRNSRCTAESPVKCEDGSCQMVLDQCPHSDDCPGVRCPGGFCVASASQCATQKTCALGTVLCRDGTCRADETLCDSRARDQDALSPYAPVRCADGSVAPSLYECASHRVCPASRPVKCDDHSCQERLSDCPPTSDCGTNFMCPNGFCLATDTTECTTSVTCPANLPFVCFDGTCRATLSDCPAQISCPASKPFLCPSGTCAENRRSCSVQPTICTDPVRPVKCSDGTCSSSREQCEVSSECPTGKKRCEDQSCVYIEYECPEESNDACPDNTPIQCDNRQCVVDDGDCLLSNGCRARYPVRCVDGSCVEDEANCPVDDEVCPIDRPHLCPDKSCKADASSCHSSDETGCYADNPFRCADGLCVESAEDCPTTVGCPSYAPVLCDDGSCKQKSSLCPVVQLDDGGCELSDGSSGFYCADGSCVTSTASCSLISPCTGDESYRCGDGSCRRIPEDCPVYNTCPSERPLRCESGECVANETRCVEENGCPVYAPVRCAGGSCVTSSDECPTSTHADNGCPISSPVRCWYGECATTQDSCLNRDFCPTFAPIRCENGTCVASTSDCVDSNEGCTGATPLQCYYGECVASSDQCLLANGCTANHPTRCADGSCVVSTEQCPRLITCPTSTVRCDDGSCVDSSDSCRPVSPCTDGRVDCPGACMDVGLSAKCCLTEEACEDFMAGDPDLEVECPAGTTECSNGACVPDAADCEENLKCVLPDYPYFCVYDSQCKRTQAECGALAPSATCADNGFVTCADGSCVSNERNCKAVAACSGATPVRTIEGCVAADSTDECVVPACDDESMTRCPDGSCRSECLPYSGCGLCEYQCPSLDCVSSSIECNMDLRCPDGYFPCFDGSCVADQTACVSPASSVQPQENTKYKISSNAAWSTTILSQSSVEPIADLAIPFGALTRATSTLTVRSVPFSSLQGVTAPVDASRLLDVYEPFQGMYEIPSTQAVRSSILSLELDAELDRFDPPLTITFRKVDLPFGDAEEKEAFAADLCVAFVNETQGTWQCAEDRGAYNSLSGYFSTSITHLSQWAVVYVPVPNPVPTETPDDLGENDDGGDWISENPAVFGGIMAGCAVAFIAMGYTGVRLQRYRRKLHDKRNEIGMNLLPDEEDPMSIKVNPMHETQMTRISTRINAVDVELEGLRIERHRLKSEKADMEKGQDTATAKFAHKVSVLEEEKTRLQTELARLKNQA